MGCNLLCKFSLITGIEFNKIVKQEVTDTDDWLTVIVLSTRKLVNNITSGNEFWNKLVSLDKVCSERG